MRRLLQPTLAQVRSQLAANSNMHETNTVGFKNVDEKKKITLKPPTDSIFNSSVFSRACKSTYQRSVNFLPAARVNTTCLAGLTHASVLEWKRAQNESGVSKKKKASGDVGASRGISRQIEGAPERRQQPRYPLIFHGRGTERGRREGETAERRSLRGLEGEEIRGIPPNASHPRRGV